MPAKRSPSRAVYADLPLKKLPRAGRRRRTALVLLGLALCMTAYASIYLRKVSSAIALSNAQDAVNLEVSRIVARIMAEYDYGSDYFVTLEKDSEGSIAAITANAAHINAFSSLVLSEMVNNARNRELEVRIPIGNLLGSNLLLGRGPEVPVEIIMLTSSFVSFDNHLTATGINQSRHQITLRSSVNVDILIPWAEISTTIVTDIPLAETVIVGRVPETYVNVTEDRYGS